MCCHILSFCLKKNIYIYWLGPKSGWNCWNKKKLSINFVTFMHFIIVISVLHWCKPCFQSAFSVRKWRGPAQTFNLTHLEFIKTNVFPIIETSVKMDTKKSNACFIIARILENNLPQISSFHFLSISFFAVNGIIVLALAPQTILVSGTVLMLIQIFSLSLKSRKRTKNITSFVI